MPCCRRKRTKVEDLKSQIDALNQTYKELQTENARWPASKSILMLATIIYPFAVLFWVSFSKSSRTLLNNWLPFVDKFIKLAILLSPTLLFALWRYFFVWREKSYDRRLALTRKKRDELRLYLKSNLMCIDAHPLLDMLGDSGNKMQPEHLGEKPTIKSPDKDEQALFYILRAILLLHKDSNNLPSLLHALHVGSAENNSIAKYLWNMNERFSYIISESDIREALDPNFRPDNFSPFTLTSSRPEFPPSTPRELIPAPMSSIRADIAPLPSSEESFESLSSSTVNAHTDSTTSETETVLANSSSSSPLSEQSGLTHRRKPTKSSLVEDEIEPDKVLRVVKKSKTHDSDEE